MGAERSCVVIGTGFEGPHFTVWNTVYTAIGAAIFWGKSGRTKLRIFCLSDVLDFLELPDGRSRKCIEFVIFVVLGCLIGIGFVKPNSVQQALTAGFAWTGVFAKCV